MQTEDTLEFNDIKFSLLQNKKIKERTNEQTNYKTTHFIINGRLCVCTSVVASYIYDNVHCKKYKPWSFIFSWFVEIFRRNDIMGGQNLNLKVFILKLL